MHVLVAILKMSMLQITHWFERKDRITTAGKQPITAFDRIQGTHTFDAARNIKV